MPDLPTLFWGICIGLVTMAAIFGTVCWVKPRKDPDLELLKIADRQGALLNTLVERLEAAIDQRKAALKLLQDCMQHNVRQDEIIEVLEIALDRRCNKKKCQRR